MMQIRYGYDITLNCPQLTPMITMLGLRNERTTADAESSFSSHSIPDVKSTTYQDLFGNTCCRFTAPVGDIQLWGDGLISDSGAPDQVDLQAAETKIPDLPNECLVYLMGSRYCETDKLSQIAWDLFGSLPSGWGRPR